MADSERLFFALWPTPQQQAAWAEVAREVLPSGAGRLLPAQNLHLTLVYLGQVDPDTRQALEAEADAIHVSPFELRLERFGHWRRPQVLWWGPQQTPAPLQALVAALRRATQACDLEVDGRPYQAHMTLARKVRRRPGRPQAAVQIWPVQDFALVRSNLLPAGAHYEILERWTLGSRAPDMG